MRKYGVLAAVAGFVLAGSVAKADFTISTQIYDLGSPAAGTNSPAQTGSTAPAMSGFTMVQFYAHNNNNGTGTKLLTANITLVDNTTGTGHGLVIGGYVDPGNPPTTGDTADLFSANLMRRNSATSPTAYIWRNTTASAVGDPAYYSFFTMVGDPTVLTDDNTQQSYNQPSGGFVPANDASTYGFSIHQFANQYGSTSGGVNASTANSSKGALFAVAVVPTNDVVGLSGSLGGDLGNPFTMPVQAIPAVVPEPATLSLLGIGMAGLLARRRRSA